MNKQTQEVSERQTEGRLAEPKEKHDDMMVNSLSVCRLCLFLCFASRILDLELKKSTTQK
jgi:hypothetical protein